MFVVPMGGQCKAHSPALLPTLGRERPPSAPPWVHHNQFLPVQADFIVPEPGEENVKDAWNSGTFPWLHDQALSAVLHQTQP